MILNGSTPKQSVDQIHDLVFLILIYWFLHKASKEHVPIESDDMGSTTPRWGAATMQVISSIPLD